MYFLLRYAEERRHPQTRLRGRNRWIKAIFSHLVNIMRICRDFLCGFLKRFLILSYMDSIPENCVKKFVLNKTHDSENLPDTYMIFCN